MGTGLVNCFAKATQLTTELSFETIGTLAQTPGSYRKTELGTRLGMVMNQEVCLQTKPVCGPANLIERNNSLFQWGLQSPKNN